MNRILALAGVVALTSAAFAQNISQINLINGPAGGTGVIAGTDLSRIEAPGSQFGAGAQTSVGNVVADDFSVGAGGFLATSLRFYMYQTAPAGAPFASPTISSISYAIVNSLSAGAATAPTLAQATATATWWDPNARGGVYRQDTTSTSNDQRRIQQIDIDIPDQILAAGTYWLMWNAAGSSTSGPWQPHIPQSLGGSGLAGAAGNALQFTATGVAGAPGWAQNFIAAGSTVGTDLPFTIVGEPVPEPMTMTVLALGAVAALRRKRKA